MSDAFLARCLLLDLETRGQEQIYRIGAVTGGEPFERKDPFLGFWPLSPHEQAPNGESFTQLAARVRRFVETMQREQSGRDGRIGPLASSPGPEEAAAGGRLSGGPRGPGPSSGSSPSGGR